MNANEAIRYIEGISSTFCKPGTERILSLCARLSHPEQSLKVIHVTGTNGKGSFCAMLESVLRAQGYKTGLFTSPAIVSLSEQIRINGENVSPELLAEATGKAAACVEQMSETPSSFELLTAVALTCFQDAACDVVILETGLGARLDATNVVDAPLLSVITGISIDHTDFLGDTVSKIAKEKAGVIKSRRPVLLGNVSPDAMRVIEQKAKEMQAPLYKAENYAPKSIRATLEGTHFDVGERRNLFIPLLGLYQPSNASTVLAAVDLLKKEGFPVSEEALHKGLSSVSWRGRFERLSFDPYIFFDGAHNPNGIDACVQSITHYFKGQRVYILTGVLADKDYPAMASMLASVTARAFTVTPPSVRALSADAYAQALSLHGIEATPYESLSSALCAARAAAKRDGVPLLCLGSLYLYASILPLLS